MKNLMLTAILFASPLSFAQGNAVPINMACDSSVNMIGALEQQYKEVPIAIADGSVYDEVKQKRGGKILLWKSTEGDTWTITFSPDVGEGQVTCMLASGKDLNIVE